MNEKLQEIAESCGIYQIERFDAIDGSNQLQRFAEIIINRCVLTVYAFPEVDNAVQIGNAVRNTFGKIN